VSVAKGIPFSSLPHFPRPTVQGHAGVLHLAHWSGLPVAILEGRLHLYEGHTPAEVAFPVRVLALVGIQVLVLTCAAGGIAPCAAPGRLMFFADHLNLQGMNPLSGPQDERWGTKFVDMRQAYDAALRRAARRAAASLHLKCFEGVYAGVLGPSFETPAEIRALRRLGADAVGMSIVPEVVAARQLGLRVLGVALITNRAAGIGKRPLSHTDVIEVGTKEAPNLHAFLTRLLPQLARMTN